MDLKFLGNGLLHNNNPVSTALNDSLQDNTFNKFTAFTAFTSVSGLEEIIDSLNDFKSNGGTIEFYLGVDEGVTNKTVLDEYLKLNVGTFIYYNSFMMRSPQKPIFHPKVYIFQGETNRIILGSSNLTSKGLSRNVEASIQIDFSNNDISGNEFLEEINLFFLPILDKTTDCIKPLNNELINNLIENGIIDEYTTYTSSSRNNSSQLQENTILFGSERPSGIPTRLPRRSQRPAQIRNSFGIYDSTNVYAIQTHSDIYGSYYEHLSHMIKKRRTAYYYIPQGIHLGHIFYIIHSYYTGELDNRIYMMYESTASNPHGTIIRQTRYKMCFIMELLLLSDDRKENISDVESIELLPNGLLLAKLLNRNSKEENFYNFKQGDESISWDMSLSPDYYINWVKSLPEIERNELFSLFKNFKLFNILLNYIRDTANFSIEYLYDNFWDYQQTTDFLSNIGIEKPQSRSSMEHRMPFIISLLRAFNIITEN